MAATVVDFTIPDDVYAVEAWFMEALPPRTVGGHREDYQVELFLSAPKVSHRAVPVVRVEIVVAAVRRTTVSIPADWAPEVVTERYEPKIEHLGPVMRFRFAALGRETYVRASCSEQLLPVLNIFVSLLKELQAHYPAIGPVWQTYETERKERVKESLDLAFGDAEGDVASDQVPAALRSEEVTRRRGPYRDSRIKMRAMWEKRQAGVRLPFSTAWQDEGLTYETVTVWIPKRVAHLWQTRKPISWAEFTELWPEHLRDDTED